MGLGTVRQLDMVIGQGAHDGCWTE